ncbi:hypothetical protein J7J37_00835 [bacterium]|nr:hypothetical protein [bacterium]
MFSFLFFLFIFAWFFFYFKKSLFLFYLWQIKEFRKDRFLSEVKKKKGIILSKKDFFSLLVLASCFLLSFFNLKISLLALLLYYPLLFLIYFSKKNIFKIKRPILTKKTFLLISLFYFFSFLAVLKLYSFSQKTFILSLFIYEIFLFFPIFLWVLIFAFFNYLLKEIKFFRARKKREKFKKLIVIGITGSYGKTSTKEFLATLLEEKFGKEKVLKTEKNENTEISIANLILNKLKEGHKFLVVEIGAYQVGEIKKVMSFLNPQIGVLTGISSQHLELFGSLEKIKKAKSEIVFNLPKNGLAVFNGSNKEVYQIARNFSFRKKIISSFEKKQGVDLWAENIEVNKDFLSFDLKKEKESVKIKLNLLGKQNGENFLTASAVALSLGLKLKEIKEIAPKILPAFSTMKKNILKNGLIIIDDTYNLNFEGIIEALRYLNNYQKKKILIMPCLIELGPLNKEIHQKIGERIKDICHLAIILESDCFAFIKEKGKEKIKFAPSLTEIENLLKKENLESGDVILLEGRIKFKRKIIDFLESEF